MGEIADDCFDRAMDELEDRDCDPDWDIRWPRPEHFRAVETHPELQKMQQVGRPLRHQSQLDLKQPPIKDFKFIAIGRAWPFRSRDFLVQAVDLESAVRDFYTNEWHTPFRYDKPVPCLVADVKLQLTGGWIVYGQEETVIIHVR